MEERAESLFEFTTLIYAWEKHEARMLEQVFLSLLLLSLGVHSLDPWRNASLPIPTRVADLLSRLTLEEKVSQMISVSAAIPRLGITNIL